MPKKVARIILVVAMAVAVVLSMIFLWPVPSFEKERDLPVLYQKVAEYLMDDYLIKFDAIHQTEGEVALLDFYKVDLSEEQREKILEYLEKKYPPINFNEPVQMANGGHIVGSYPVCEIRDLYRMKAWGRYYQAVFCQLQWTDEHGWLQSTQFKLFYVFEHGQWKFLEESYTNY